MKTKNLGQDRKFKDGLYRLSFEQRLGHNIWYRYMGHHEGWWLRVEGLPYRFRLKDNMPRGWTKILEQHILDYELQSKFLKSLNKVSLSLELARKEVRRKTVRGSRKP